MDFDRHAEKYDESFMGRGSTRFYRDLISVMEIHDGDRVLDVGCGTGTILHYIAQRKQIYGFGMDVSEAMVNTAQEKEGGCSFLVGNAESLPFEDASMDVVTACMAYHHFPDQQKFREEAMRILKMGGRLYICDPRFPALVRGLLNTLFKEAGFQSSEKNARDLSSAGFVEEQIVKDAYVQVLCFRKAEV